MRKMLSDGRGARVHFTLSDHEWEWFEMACRLSGSDPMGQLSAWASDGLSPSEIREMVRGRITGVMNLAVTLVVPSASARSQNARPS